VEFEQLAPGAPREDNPSHRLAVGASLVELRAQILTRIIGRMELL